MSKWSWRYCRTPRKLTILSHQPTDSFKSQCRYNAFLDDLHQYAANDTASVVVGPVHGLTTHLATMGAQLKIENGDIIIYTALGTSVNLLKDQVTYIQASPEGIE